MLKTSISSLETLLTTTIVGELDVFLTQLAALESDSLNVFSAPVQVLMESEDLFVDFKTELEDVDSAIDALDT